jgi:hypothetical protein
MDIHFFEISSLHSQEFFLHFLGNCFSQDSTFWLSNEYFSLKMLLMSHATISLTYSIFIQELIFFENAL